jgi:polysaccharide pyruvyl transferase CsaB
MRILVSGYYGFGNLGDEALLEIIVAQLRTRFPLAEIDVLSAQPEETAHRLGVAATQRTDLGLVRRAIERADVVLSGGGGLLQNATSLKSLLYYAGIIRSAIKAGKKTMIFAQSIGPLDFIGKQTVRECCRGLRAATVRDERSRELLAGLVSGIVVERTADPVFLYERPPASEAPDDRGVPRDGALVVVSVRKTAHFETLVPRLATAVDRLAEAHGARVAFVALGGQADADAATSVIRKCRSHPMLLPIEGLAATAAVLEQAQLVIGVRLHALILAARFGVPFLAVPYDPKVTGLCEDLAYPLPPLWRPSERGEPGEELTALVDRAWNERAVLRAWLGPASERMRGLARRNFTALEELVRA